MSEYYWQLQTNTQHRKNDAKDGDEWSSVGLTSDNINERSEQQQQTYWWCQQNQNGTDPYCAAAFEGFRASSGDGNGINSWQTSITPDSHTAHYEQEQSVQIVLINAPQQGQQYSFGVHQRIMDSEYSTEGKEVSNGKENQQFQHGNISSDLAGGNLATLLPEEKEEVINEAESGVSLIAAAQGAPVISTSPDTTMETSFVQSSCVLSCSQTFPTAYPSDANIAHIVSVQNASGFSTSSDVPALQPVIPDLQSSGTSVFLVGETSETQNNTTIVESAQAISSIVNLHQLTGAAVSVSKEESVANTGTGNPHSTDVVHDIQEQNDLKSISQRDYKEQNSAIVTSAELSADSTALDSCFSEIPPQKHKDSKNVRDRYRIIRQQYPEVVKRLDRLRMETHGLGWRPVQKSAVIETDGSSHMSMSNKRQRNSTVIDPDSNAPSNLKNVEAISVSRPSSKMNHSYTLPERLSSEDSSTKNDVYYGEDFVNSLRRNRHARTREHDYFLSRGTKSEMGEIGPYRGPALSKHKQYLMMQHSYGYHSSAGCQPYEYYPSGRQSLGPHLGRRAAHELAMMYNEDTSHPRRPQSSFDAPTYSKYQHLNEFAQDSHQDDLGEHSFESADESSGSDSEIARIHNEQEMMRRAATMRYNPMPLAAPNEFYYFGVIQLPQVERVEYIMRRIPPPPEYFQLPPVEKAAYMFYCVLYRHHYLPVDLFHKKFNREYFNYMCEGDSAEIALWKICKHTQEEYIAKRSASQLKAYEMSQKQLFSDDHETLDSRQSERGSRCDPEDDSDQISIDSAAKEPMKFRIPHSFLRFGAGGKVIVLNVQNSENILEIRNLKSLFGDHKLLHFSNAIESFRGPLIAGFTPTHSVHLYVQRQIEFILKSEAYHLNPLNSLESDCLLIWQLLEMLVQQQGRVTGPDLSRLLMSSCPVSEQRRHSKEKSHSLTPANFSERSVDPKAYDRFTQLLLGGHVKEALDSAVKDGLYSDAMILARRMCVQESQELEKVETAFLSHRSELNPVMTLLAVANGQPAPVLTSPPMDEASSWRSHAAIVLANLNTPAALGTVYQLGCVLSRRGLHTAADFCFLAVSLLLPGYNPFQPVPKRFSVIDLHATEIFQYSVKLARGGSFNTSTAYQLYRLDYVEMIAEFGNSAVDAFRYCVEIAKEIWDRCNEIDVENLERLYELAERLKFAASADANSVGWLPTLRSLIDEQQKVISDNKVMQSDATAVVDHDIEDVMTPKVSPKAKVAVDLVKSTDRQKEDLTTNSQPIDWNTHQETLAIPSVSVMQQQGEIGKPEHNECDAYQEQLSEKVGACSNMESANLFQHSTMLVSTRDSGENSSTSHATVTSTMVPQASGRVSHEPMRSYCDGNSYERKVLKMEEQNDSTRPNSEIATEITTEPSTTSAISYEDTPQRNVDHSEEKISNGALLAVTGGSQFNGALHSGYFPSTVLTSNSNQHPSVIPERSNFSQEQRNAVKKSEKMHTKENIADDHRQNSGLFSKLKATIAKAIPSGNEMILPDDKNPSIVWDPKLNRYVGEGIEEEPVPEPPPSVTQNSERSNELSHGNVGGLTAARLSGGSRYFNPLIETSPSKVAAPSLLPPVPTATTFGFIPSMPALIIFAKVTLSRFIKYHVPDDNDASTESPFSTHTELLPQEADIAD
uniref:Protein transport protein sec16 n=1 Tax=Setaria digitata TaxID=48799 RepID=A0A915Q1S7_9BILA